MRLLDQIAQARAPLEIIGHQGVQAFPSAADFSGAIASCPVRFVLDQNAADRCLSLLRSDHGMLAAENSFIRVPAPHFWIEWPCPPAPNAGTRTGLLVEADESGRRGRITTFWEQADHEPLPAQAVVFFELSDAPDHWSAYSDAAALAPGTHPLAPNLLFKMEGAWEGHVTQSGELIALQSTRLIAANLMPGVEFLFAFSALLIERLDLEQRPVDQTRLNRQRTKKGKPSLLDHVEVRLDLTTSERMTGSRPEHVRGAARLHHVRGHMVRRKDATFWRRSHLRGDASAPVAQSRTARVTCTGHPTGREKER